MSVRFSRLTHQLAHTSSYGLSILILGPVALLLAVLFFSMPSLALAAFWNNLLVPTGFVDPVTFRHTFPVIVTLLIGGGFLYHRRKH